MSHDSDEIQLIIPEGMTLEQVILSCDPDMQVMEYDDDVVRDICDANDIPHSTFLDDNLAFTNFLIAWYLSLKEQKAVVPPVIDVFFIKCLQSSEGSDLIH